MKIMFVRACPAVILTSFLFAIRATAAAQPTNTPWVEASFPFFSSVLDARQPAQPGLENNLTPRGIVLNLGNESWACFDLDLLRVSAMWRGAGGVSARALAPLSYIEPNRSTPSGQGNLPKPEGEWWLANGIYAG